MRKFLSLLIIASFVIIPSALKAEDGETPQTDAEMQAEMDEVLGAMGPAMSSMMEGMMAGMFSLLAKPETAEQLATFSKNYYDALVRKGFTKEEALRIVTMTDIPSMGQ